MLGFLVILLFSAPLPYTSAAPFGLCSKNRAGLVEQAVITKLTDIVRSSGPEPDLSEPRVRALQAFPAKRLLGYYRLT